MKKLATIRTITDTVEMTGFDNVHLIHVDGWQAIAPKDMTAGQTIVFIEPGAKCPDNDIFHFLQKRDFKIKTMKMRGYLSQGLALPVDILGSEKICVGDDVTEKLGLTDFTEQDTPVLPERKPKGLVGWLMKYRMTRWIGRLFLPKKVSGNFPDFVSKTDEERVQNMPWVLSTEAEQWVLREKVDGMSGTWAVKKHKTWYGKTVYEFFCCSRNYRLNPKYDKGTPQFILSEKFQLEKLMTLWLKMHPEEDWVCIQGECVGPKIQGNPYKLNNLDMYAFNLITSKCGRLRCSEGINIISFMRETYELPEIKWAPIVGMRTTSTPFTDTSVSDVLNSANGKSEINPEVIREGIVVRSYDKNISFKVVSPDYLMKKGE